ncbi:undecaprenyl-diphosphate phosphatase [soil metagenome]
MTTWEAIFLGALQGATEFLPVSSSGHLVMGQVLMGIELPGILFEIVVHVATLLSVLVVYRERILALAGGALVERSADAWRYIGYLAVATLPVAVVGVAFGDTVAGLFDDPRVVGVALLVTGALLFSSRWPLRRPLETGLGWRVALIIGLTQCLALTPGISRSGTTVVTALWLGVRPVEAAAFSFLLSIPAIGGAAVLAIPDLSEGAAEIGAIPLAAAAVVAAVVGVLAIRTFVAMLQNRSFPAFAGYCWAAGAGFLLWLAFAGA